MMNEGHAIQRNQSVFVAMPFAPEFENVFDFGIRLPLEVCGYEPVRTDKQFFTGLIVEEIKKRISESSFIIADISTSNANVLFELGYAAGSNKPSVIICRKGEELPFDVAGMNIISYDPLFIRELKGTMEQMLITMAEIVAQSEG